MVSLSLPQSEPARDLRRLTLGLVLFTCSFMWCEKERDVSKITPRSLGVLSSLTRLPSR